MEYTIGMSDQLNSALAVAKQAYEELTGLVPLADLQRGAFGSGPKRQRVADLLSRLNATLNAVRRALSKHVEESSETPVLSVPSAHRTFYNEILLPHGKALQRAHLEIEGLSLLVGLLEDAPEEKSKSSMLNAISWSLERWNIIDEDERFDWYERGFDIDGAQELVAMPWFRPDDWSQNLRLLQPVLVDRPTKVMRDHVHYRLIEIYRAFAFGLWMAAIALSRSLVEFSVKANASRLGFSTTYQRSNGEIEEKSLWQLGEDVAAVNPELAIPIETVRDTGNRILHPTKHDIVSHPKVMRDEALKCVRAASLVVEGVYSEVRR
jgi:hypothetical protein